MVMYIPTCLLFLNGLLVIAFNLKNFLILYIGIHIMRRLAHMMFTRLYPMGTEGESFTALLEGFVQFMEYRVEICDIG